MLDLMINIDIILIQNLKSLLGMMLKFPTIFHRHHSYLSVIVNCYYILVDLSFTAKYILGRIADLIMYRPFPTYSIFQSCFYMLFSFFLFYWITETEKGPSETDM